MEIHREREVHARFPRFGAKSIKYSIKHSDIDYMLV